MDQQKYIKPHFFFEVAPPPTPEQANIGKALTCRTERRHREKKGYERGNYR
jgi:hypothetical protein